MPDITMCNGDNCPLKETCYRFTATPDEFRQTYFTDAPYNRGECSYHYKNYKINEFKDEEGKINEDK